MPVTLSIRWFTVLLAITSLTAYGANMKSLADYQWNHRLILVQAAPETGGAIALLRAARADVDERDIIWFVNTGSGVVSNQATVSSGVQAAVIGLLGQGSADERVLLIGKDGGLKSRAPTLNLNAIFRRIDAMPMRIREMQSE